MYVFVNSFGGITDDSFFVTYEYRKMTVRIEDITKILLVKTRKLHLNILFFIISILFLVVFMNNNVSFLFDVLTISISILFMIFCFLFTSIQYKFVLVKKFDFIELIIDEKMQLDAEILISEFNQRTGKV
ncbi:MAG: hypothetical protein PHW29_10625 [Flavobacterium sp.]|jgi:carbon starvation protein CstA|nr:hypothetical protein [uncultured Flavobacterium sp.]MDD2821705.1 hypothetical protein [Flavobacterium sp.]